MTKNILKELPQLVAADLISEETADKIRSYYRNKEAQPKNVLFIVFGILGAILVGLGIILIVAHNWDEIPRSAKTILAFLPLVAGQALCGYVLLKRKDNRSWRESTAAFLFFAVGASISLVSQIYNIPGNLGPFLLTWMLLCLPLIYVMKSSVASLLCLIGITYYAAETGYWSYPVSGPYIYWLLLLLVLPHYYLLVKENPQSNFVVFHNWLVPLSLIISLGTVARETEELMFIAYFSLFGLLYMVGNTGFLTEEKRRNNGYLILGALGTIVLLLMVSFNWFWTKMERESFSFAEVIRAPEFFAALLLSVAAGALFFRQQKSRPFHTGNLLETTFLFFLPVFVIGLYSSMLPMFLINLFVFFIGVLTIGNGARQNHLGVLNFGLLIISALVVCRFFDTNMSFVVRGILFVLVGAGFFLFNYNVLKKRKTSV